MTRKTFMCDNSMIITIPIGSLRDAREGELMPEKFHCIFRDAYKVFALNGKPKPFGAAQAITGVFLLCLGLVFKNDFFLATIPSIVFVVCGILTYAAGQFPNMLVTKFSFFLNIVSFLWSIVACSLCIIWFVNHFGSSDASKMQKGLNGLILGLLAVEDLMAIFLMYWLSKAVCRDSFNSLPTVLIKQGD
ncbi:uncharacterized protein [Eucyclogobius newberryi]|uniref:uncharacterized protein n=1 Tax=Eucyclogobius newberryi TaxID=166745 RepID=UPI003B5BEC33